MQVEVTDADREAVKSYYVETGFVADQKGLEQAFARHRIAERAAIVEWLRKVANINPQEPAAKAFVLLLCKAIEGGEYIK